MADVWSLTEVQMARLAPLLPNDTRGVPRVDDRRVISGIVHVLRSGGRRADAPASYGPRKTLYDRAEAGGPPAELLLDSSTMKAHRCAAGGNGGSGRRRFAWRPATTRSRLTSWPQSI